MTSAPFPTGRTTIVGPSDLTGYIFGWDDLGPVFIRMIGSEAYYLACFSSFSLLHAFHSRTRVPYSSIKKIDEGTSFLESVPLTFQAQPLRVILDPYVTPEGRIRFLELRRDGADAAPNKGTPS
jgi:hypothetical protein